MTTPRSVESPELLAPAGDFEKLQFAFAYGADAVYAGLPMFSLRTKENKFDLDQVKRGIEYAHQLNKKLYVTANIYAHNVKIEPFLEALEQVVPLGADAFIMSDPGLIDLVRETYPQLPVHLSTQSNNTNWAQARFWKKLGIQRIILARELTINEIQEISEKNPGLETECFVHGAMCMAYSGRCMLSDYFSGRPSNSGACTQSCRWEYKIGQGMQERPPEEASAGHEYTIEEKLRPGQKFPVSEDEFGTYIFNSKDLCALDVLPEIVKSGVRSVKIEGRNKGLLYLATVVRVYREALDACLEGTFEKGVARWREELGSIDQRGYTLGFLKGDLKDNINYERTVYATRTFVGKIIQHHPDNLLEIDLRGRLSVGEEIEWITPHQGILRETVTKLFDANGHPIETVAAGGTWNPKIHSNLDLNEFCLARSVIKASP